jgi:hypothetical protein
VIIQWRTPGGEKESLLDDDCNLIKRRVVMRPEIIFPLHLVLGYVACLLVFSTYALPRLRMMERADAHRVFATIHSFRFFGLVFMLPGFVGPGLPASFATFAAYGDFVTGLLAILALLFFRIRPLFWSLVVAFNLAGITDIVVDYFHAIQTGVPQMAGQLGAAYYIPVIYVPFLMITHMAGLYWLLRPQPRALPALQVEAR